MAIASYQSSRVPVFTATARSHGLEGSALPPDQAHHVSIVAIPNLWVLERIGDDWQVAYRMAVQDGAAVIAEIRLYPAEPISPVIEPSDGWREGTNNPVVAPGEWSGAWQGINATVPRGGITARLLRQVMPTSHVRQARDQIRRLQADAVAKKRKSAFRATLRNHGIETLVPPEPKPPSPRHGKRPLKRVAVLYTRAVRNGSTSPNVDVAIAIKKNAIKKNVKWATNAISAARKAGLLPPTTRGRMMAT